MGRCAEAGSPCEESAAAIPGGARVTIRSRERGTRHTRTWTEVSDDTRNMILAIVLSAAVLLGWGLLSERFFPTP